MLSMILKIFKHLYVHLIANTDEIIKFMLYPYLNIYYNFSFMSLLLQYPYYQKVYVQHVPSFDPFIFGYIIDNLYQNLYKFVLIL